MVFTTFWAFWLSVVSSYAQPTFLEIAAAPGDIYSVGVSGRVYESSLSPWATGQQPFSLIHRDPVGHQTSLNVQKYELLNMLQQGNPTTFSYELKIEAFNAAGDRIVISAEVANSTLTKAHFQLTRQNGSMGQLSSLATFDPTRGPGTSNAPYHGSITLGSRVLAAAVTHSSWGRGPFLDLTLQDANILRVETLGAIHPSLHANQRAGVRESFAISYDFGNGPEPVTLTHYSVDNVIEKGRPAKFSYDLAIGGDHVANGKSRSFSVKLQVRDDAVSKLEVFVDGKLNKLLSQTYSAGLGLGYAVPFLGPITPLTSAGTLITGTPSKAGAASSTAKKYRLEPFDRKFLQLNDSTTEFGFNPKVLAAMKAALANYVAHLNAIQKPYQPPITENAVSIIVEPYFPDGTKPGRYDPAEFLGIRLFVPGKVQALLTTKAGEQLHLFRPDGTPVQGSICNGALTASTP